MERQLRAGTVLRSSCGGATLVFGTLSNLALRNQLRRLDLAPLLWSSRSLVCHCDLEGLAASAARRKLHVGRSRVQAGNPAILEPVG
jgi:hypothetical protein